ncbi:hypothetical protein B0H10DRAFT_1959281 [Mycena sp. CBHHK59/15]|nr:hypothetical protein B0H10DRAFT_1959281 [Mycena sp. CBHHK59/15]
MPPHIVDGERGAEHSWGSGVYPLGTELDERMVKICQNLGHKKNLPWAISGDSAGTQSNSVDFAVSEVIESHAERFTFRKGQSDHEGHSAIARGWGRGMALVADLEKRWRPTLSHLQPGRVGMRSKVLLGKAVESNEVDVNTIFAVECVVWERYKGNNQSTLIDLGGSQDQA